MKTVLQEIFEWMESTGVELWRNKDKSWTVEVLTTLAGGETDGHEIRANLPTLQEALLEAFRQWTEVQVVNRVCDAVGIARRGAAMVPLLELMPKDTGKLAPDRTDLIGPAPEDWRVNPEWEKATHEIDISHEKPLLKQLKPGASFVSGGGQSDSERVLRELVNAKGDWVADLYKKTHCMVHSRVADLRKKGYQIEAKCFGDRDWRYRLVYGPADR